MHAGNQAYILGEIHGFEHPRTKNCAKERFSSQGLQNHTKYAIIEKN